MKKAMQAILIITLLPLCLIGCGPKTKVTSSWINEQQVPKIGTILIIAISRNEISRRLWEDSFVEQFTVKNINAVASHTIKAEPIPPEEKSVLQIVESAKADTVIISHLIDSKTSTDWHPGSVHYVPNGMYGYYNSAYNAVYTPPTSVTRTVVRLTAASLEIFDMFVTCPFCLAAISRKRRKDPTFLVRASARISSLR